MQAYCRCNSGHYFEGEFCPFDGWSSAASTELTAVVKELNHAGKSLSLAELRRMNVSPATLLRTLIIEFGSQDSAFEALAPEQLVVDGQAQDILQLDTNFK
jgi:hypothetical protein